jgi:hypothetical protein
MSETTIKRTTKVAKTYSGPEKRTYQSDSTGLMSLRLIAAPNPKDDLSDAELKAMCKDQRCSPELIQHLIDFVKNL